MNSARVLSLAFAHQASGNWRAPIAQIFAAILAAQVAVSVRATEGEFQIFASGSSIYAGSAVVSQPDGKILIGGDFTQLGSIARKYLARLNADGSLENIGTFNPGSGPNAGVYAIAVQNDGKIVLGGGFTSINGQTRNRLARLNPDGTLESTATFNPGTGANNTVNAIAIQPDGKIVLGGFFDSVNVQSRKGVARLNPDGSVESTATFNPGTGANNNGVNTVALQPDGKILLGGSFSTVNGQPRSCIARLNGDGTIEDTATFNPGSGVGGGVFLLLAMAVQPNGKIVLGGAFASFDGQPRNNVARLNANGTLESSATFDPGSGTDARIRTIALQADGKIVIGGDFGTINGLDVLSGFARLKTDGAVDNRYAGLFAGSHINGLALQADGKLFVASDFYVSRFLNGAGTQALTVPSTVRLQWMRGGSAPEVEQVAFELSVNNGTTWSPLGTGIRIVGGWEFTGLNLSSRGLVRARGRTIGGRYMGSSGLTEITTTAFDFGTPLTIWKMNNLADAAAPDTGDIDFDGLVHLAEYALLLSPTAPSPPPGASVFAYAEGDRLRMFVPRDPAHNDITVSVEATGDIMAGPWTPLATSTLGAPFTGPGYVGGDDATPGVKTVEVRDLVNLSATTQRWLRVKVTH